MFCHKSLQSLIVLMLINKIVCFSNYPIGFIDVNKGNLLKLKIMALITFLLRFYCLFWYLKLKLWILISRLSLGEQFLLLCLLLNNLELLSICFTSCCWQSSKVCHFLTRQWRSCYRKVQLMSLEIVFWSRFLCQTERLCFVTFEKTTSLGIVRRIFITSLIQPFP